MSLKMEAASLNEIKEMVKRHEGYRLEPYRCTENKLTGGYGHVILPGEEVPTTKEGWDAIFDADFDKAVEGAARICEGMSMSDKKFGVWISMCFQLGENGTSKFKNAISAAKEQNWELCSRELLNSRWHKQTPHRCEELADIIREEE